MSPEQFDLRTQDSPQRCLVVGVINLTPDSFSDGGTFLDSGAAVARAEELTAAGADWLDIGAESTRPGSQPVTADEQIRRCGEIIGLIARQLKSVISIDTTVAAVAERALDQGATIVNDVSAGRFDPAMLPLVARRGAGVVLMHMQQTPATMQEDPRYGDVYTEVADFLTQRASAAEALGIRRNRIFLDPGIGFGKTQEHDLKLLSRLRGLTGLGYPVLVGPSRKRFIGRIIAEPRAADRIFGTAGAVAWCATNGAAAVRVHDVKAMAQVVQVVAAIADAREKDTG